MVLGDNFWILVIGIVENRTLYAVYVYNTVNEAWL